MMIRDDPVLATPVLPKFAERGGFTSIQAPRLSWMAWNGRVSIVIEVEDPKGRGSRRSKGFMKIEDNGENLFLYTHCSPRG